MAASWLVPAIIIAVHTGLRQGELLRLKWTDLAPALQLATIPLTKNNEVKYVPLNAEVQAALASLPRHGATVLAWPWGEPISRITLYYAFQRALAAAGITDFRWHHLRHTFASHRVMAGVDLHTTGDLLGHRDPQHAPLLASVPHAQGGPGGEAHDGACSRGRARARRRGGRIAPADRPGTDTFRARAEQAADPGEAKVCGRSPPWRVEAGGIEPLGRGRGRRRR